MTGVYTGRSPKDKFFVKNEASEIQYGGLLTNIKTITNLVLKKLGLT